MALDKHRYIRSVCAARADISDQLVYIYWVLYVSVVILWVVHTAPQLMYNSHAAVARNTSVNSLEYA